ncbi:hypothetical protein AVEN_57507-1 [Araneus ventricosus]|uniref:Uncharacterized protein n=1 Tax=Araneus ventricosus TaxID=182803 RepID=A0A4Y2CZ24_ARAVE|nr:hypothetical protein AVEN_57507-1 [Araneus ventricosus]
MVNTRYQTKTAENADLLALLADLKKGQEEMRKGQEEMRKGQEEMKSQIQAHVESQVEEITYHAKSCIQKIEEDIQGVKIEAGELRAKSKGRPKK